jgi:hypothetical protein
LTTQATNTMRSSSGNPSIDRSRMSRPSSTPGATPCNNPRSAALSGPNPPNGAFNGIFLSGPLGYSTARGAASLRVSTDVTTTAEDSSVRRTRSVNDTKLLAPTQREKALRRRLGERPSDRLQASCRREHRPR